MKAETDKQEQLKAFSLLGKYLAWTALILVGVMFSLVLAISGFHLPRPPCADKPNPSTSGNQLKPVADHIPQPEYWTAPDTTQLQRKADADLIRYGRNLIVSTASYLGPKGTVGKLANGMNCQNCHLDAGTRPFANNFSVFYSGFPKMTARSGRKEEAFERIDECFERSMNGKAPERNSREMQAMLSYLKWIGEKPVDAHPLADNSVKKIPYLSVPADPLKGKMVYASRCSSCHGEAGKGLASIDGKGYIYPPLWGGDSYNDGAGMFRLGNFAGFVKENMPYGTSYKDPVLSDEEAWNVAAYVNSQPRPHLGQKNDYPELSRKPIDYPFGPYADSFTERQHKYGPFIEIEKQHLTKTKK
ncbi:MULTISPECIES: c-type cytochrome [unclassified Pedobacter]|uniref:c-type cytochrome n=1 Tax=unclassified Pedobacter TaxID=2628915 RepID=UPI001DDF10B0|nr:MULTISPECIES: c-type cytochrome [unclassified Pedobacter]CAH0265018.1 Thiosulfate dehydrogenase [Pedobacter sp. Bi36]CAH0291481.1 Thiosulfate dehydrogenase [Pedobacter sp. Bi126]